MSSRTLRRRLHHKDVDGGRYDRYETSRVDSLNEPLLGDDDRVDHNDNKHTEGQTLADILDDERSKVRLHWALIFSNVIAQWAQWLGLHFLRCKIQKINMTLCIAVNDKEESDKVNSKVKLGDIICAMDPSNIVLGSGSLLGRILPFVSGNQNGANSLLQPMLLSPLQDARLKHIKQRLAVPFDGTFLEHQDALRQLWRLSYPDRELPSLKSEAWKEMGWQGSDPSTDFRGGGFISLENLIFFAKKYPEAFQNLLHKRDGQRSEWEYPFAVAGINISFMLVQMLDLQSGNPSTLAGQRFMEILSYDDMAFDNLFCVAFKLLDAQWLAQRASYMEFNDVLKSTRSQLEREMALEDVSSVSDLPAYNLLRS
ncbi:ELMO/CED-12 family protein [Striga asiatica]|uniref:ELMO/CED-12 family protein n=1 Tax=Striga asiatica TaxID=4170 RepID=A0A5A7PZ00_STRAF|nr:ELMO/CED-12 family protein [Striga asiatica]